MFRDIRARRRDSNLFTHVLYVRIAESAGALYAVAFRNLQNTINIGRIVVSSN